ncbi:putative membrane family protein [Acanthocheilonema viteae]
MLPQATNYSGQIIPNHLPIVSFENRMINSNVRSSLPLQIILYLNRPISCIFVAIILFLYFFKISILPYATNAKICELLLIILFIPNEAMRLYWARKGNLTETSGYLSFALLLNVLTLSLCVYWALFQSYVLFIEFVIVCVEAILVIIETWFAIIAIANFSRSSNI